MSVKCGHMPLISRVSYMSELLISRVKLKFVSSVELLMCVLHVSCNWIWPSCGTDVLFLFTKMVLILWRLLNHPTEHHFGSSGMTLNERFTKYLKKGMEQDAAKNKKSPEIHRLVALRGDFMFPSLKLESFWSNSRIGENGWICT